MSLILLEEQVYTALAMKETSFSPPLAEVNQPIFTFKWTDPVGGYDRQRIWTRLPKDLKTLSADFLSNRQRFFGKMDYKRVTE